MSINVAAIASCLRCAQLGMRDATTLFVCEAAVLLVAVIVLLRLWRPLLSPQGVTRDDGVNSPGTLHLHMARDESRLAWTFLAVCTCWMLFYLTEAVLGLLGPELLDLNVPDTFLPNVFTNLGTYALIRFYLTLSAFRRHGITSERYSGLIRVGALSLIAACTAYEFLATCPAHMAIHEHPDRERVFQMVYGFGQAMGLYLVIGRLESASISDHIKHNVHGFLWLYRLGVVLGYCYATIQPLYPLFKERNSSAVYYLVVLAFGFKIALILWMHVLFVARRGAGCLSPIQHQLYETTRFANEELSSFERTFLRRHFNALYTKKTRDRGIGYLGVEYSYLNDFKKDWLRLTDSHVEPLAGGILVHAVYGGSNALTHGVRVGDFVTTVGGVPLGHHNRLSTALTGIGLKGHVEITLLRKRFPAKPVSKSSDYEERCLTFRLQAYESLTKSKIPDEAGAKLGCTFVTNNPDHGVVCRWSAQGETFTIIGITSKAFGRHYETPDVRLLRFALSQLIPGEDIWIHRLEESSLQHRVMMGLESQSRVRVKVPNPKLPKSEHWTPLGEEERFDEMEEPESTKALPELLKRYPDRFAPRHKWLNLGSEPWKNAMIGDADDKGCTIFAFDDQYAKVLQYQSHCRDPVRDTRTLEIWKEIASGRIYLFVGRLQSDRNELEREFSQGSFFVFEHDREAYIVERVADQAEAARTESCRNATAR